MNPPNKEEDIVEKWYACIYETKNKNHLYKAVRRYMDDIDGPATGLEIECLKPYVGTGNILESVPEHLERDFNIFHIFNVIDGPLDVVPLKDGKWEITSYQYLKEKFQECQYLDRKTLYINNVCLCI